MTNILMISGSFPPDKCGVGDYTKILCDNLYEKSVQLNVISSFTTSDVKYPVDSSVKNWSFFSLKKILTIIDNLRPDIVHIQYPTKAYGKSIAVNLLPIVLKLKKRKVITTVHEYSDNSFLGKLRIIPNLLFSDSILVVDPIYKQDMIKVIPFIKNKVQFINIASNIPKSLLSEQEKMELKKTIINDRNTRVIGYFGFVNESKQIEIILESLAILKNREELNSKLLMIAELDKQNKYHKIILDLIEDYKLKEDIIITGYMKESDVANYIALADYFILPFKNGFSPKNGSALAALQEGKHVISTLPKSRVSNLQNLIFLKNSNSADELIKLIKDFQNRDLEKSFDDNSIYCWDNISDKHIEVYKELVRS